MPAPFRRCVALAALLACLTSGQAMAQALRTTVPPGFEDLDAPQTAPVDLYFGGRPIGDAMATFAPGWIELADPQAVLDAIDAILPERQAEVLAALSGRLDTHVSASCAPEPFPGCGSIEVPVAGVIFNPDYFRLEVAIAPSHLSVREIGGRYLPEPVSGPSLLANLSAGASGNLKDDDQTLTAGIQSRFSLGRTALRLDAYAQNSSDNSAVDVLAGEHFGQDHLFQMGFIEDFSTRFSRVPGLLGVRLETYQDTRLDLDQRAGSPIFLFLPERSQVELFRDGRLMAARSYEAGNQQIDTSSLPRGSYPVTLRIRSASGAVSEQTVDFVKDLSFPAPGEWQYFAEAGMVTEDDQGGFLPAVESTPIVKAGLSRRLMGNLAVSTALGATDQAVLGEIDLRYLGSIADAGLQLAATSEGGLGVGGNAAWRLGRFSAAVSGDLVVGSDTAGNDQTKDEVQDWNFGQLTDDRQSLTLSAGYGWDNGARLQLRGYYRNQESESFAIGPNFSMPLYRDRVVRTDLELNATHGNNEQLLFARVRLSYAPPDQPYRVRAFAGTRFRETQSSDGDQGLGMFGSLGASYRLDGTLGGATLLDAELGRDVDGSSRLSLAADMETVHGSGNVGIDLEDRTGGQQMIYRGFARTTLAANRDGLAIGGRRPGHAAILADFDGPDQAGKLAVQVGSDTVQVRSGSSAVLPVGAFRSYQPSAKAVDGQIVDLRQLQMEAPLYPGNVATMRWTVRKLTSYYGRILWPDGSPMVQARILGVDGLALTDTLGYFVAELEEEAGELEVDPRDGSKPCAITLAVDPAAGDADVVSVGDLVCR